MRLAFSICTAYPADIVLMDEWLSVGDAEFSKKAEKRLLEFIKKSSILVWHLIMPNKSERFVRAS